MEEMRVFSKLDLMLLLKLPRFESVLSVLSTIQGIAAILPTFNALAIVLKYTSPRQEAQDVCHDEHGNEQNQLLCGVLWKSAYADSGHFQQE